MNAIRHLDALGAQLGRRGWSASLRLEEPPLLRVWHPSRRGVGESVGVVSFGGEAWFWSSTGTLLAPCSDLRLARVNVGRGLSALAPKGPRPWRPLVWRRR